MNATDTTGNHALHIAVQSCLGNSQLDAVRRLLVCGADVEAVCFRYGTNALQKAAGFVMSASQDELCKWLLQMNADPSAKVGPSPSGRPALGKSAIGIKTLDRPNRGSWIAQPSPRYAQF